MLRMLSPDCRHMALQHFGAELTKTERRSGGRNEALAAIWQHAGLVVLRGRSCVPGSRWRQRWLRHSTIWKAD